MGNWGNGVAENDAACDGLSDLAYYLLDELEPAVERADVGRIEGLLGVLLQISPFDFTPESDRFDTVRDAAQFALERAEAPSRAVLAAIAARSSRR
jgi:hypothetical protein